MEKLCWCHWKPILHNLSLDVRGLWVTGIIKFLKSLLHKYHKDGRNLAHQKTYDHWSFIFTFKGPTLFFRNTYLYSKNTVGMAWIWICKNAPFWSSCSAHTICFYSWDSSTSFLLSAMPNKERKSSQPHQAQNPSRKPFTLLCWPLRGRAGHLQNGAGAQGKQQYTRPALQQLCLYVFQRRWAFLFPMTWLGHWGLRKLPGK